MSIFSDAVDYVEGIFLGDDNKEGETFLDYAGDFIGALGGGDSSKGIKSLISLGLGGAQAFGLLDQDRPPVGYQGKIPEYTAIRQAVPRTYDPSRVPGSAGQRYFTQTEFVAPSGIEAAREAAASRAMTLAGQNIDNPAQARRPVTMQAGGLAGLAARKPMGRYLAGRDDGMADTIPASINGKQPAALSDGEYVVAADVVSHLGNGNSEAGAKVLDDMMTRIRKARTGNPKQGKEVNPRNFTPV